MGLLQSYKRINGEVVSFDYKSTRKLDHGYYPSFTLDYDYFERLRKTSGDGTTAYQYSDGKLVHKSLNEGIDPNYGYDHSDVISRGTLRLQ